jgi:DsbC/DsbD-like thiol-disulfide interchange protein
MRTLLPPLLAGALGALLGPLPAAGVAGDWAVNGPSRMRLISEYRVAPGNASGAWLGLHFRLEPDWHVYWKNSGDAGYPPALVLAGSPGGVRGELLWPAPRRFELRGGLVAFGYADEVVYPVETRLAAGAADREHLSAEVDYVVCQVDCIPFHSRLTLDQPLAAPGQESPDPATAPLLAAARDRLPVAIGSLPGITAETGFAASPTPALTVQIRPVTAAPSGADLFLEPQDLFETGKPEVTRQADGLRFRVPLTLKQVGKPLPATFPFAWTATGLQPAGGGRPHQPMALADRRTVRLGAPSPAAHDRQDPRVRPLGLALAAVLSTLSALGLWGLLGPERPGAGAVREGLGFLAAAGTLGLLYALSRSVRTEGLAAVELSLLAMALLAWLRRKAGRGKLAGALVVALGLCAGAALWFAVQSRMG